MFGQLLENGGGCVRTAVRGMAAGVWAAAQRMWRSRKRLLFSFIYKEVYVVGKQVQILLLILGFYEMKSEQAVSVATREA